MPTCSTRDTKNMFRFPRDSALEKQWLENLAMPDYSPSSADRVCHLHFSPQLIVQGAKYNKLKTGAVPGDDQIIIKPYVREIRFEVEHCGEVGEVVVYETAKVATLKSNISSLTGCSATLKIKFLDQAGGYFEANEETYLSELDLPAVTQIRIACPKDSPCQQGIVGDKDVSQL